MLQDTCDTTHAKRRVLTRSRRPRLFGQQRLTLLIESLGLRIRRLRELRGQTQQELAAIAGVSPKHLGELERGNGNPSLQSIHGLATALGLSLNELFDMEQEAKTDLVLRMEISKRLQRAKPGVLRVIHQALRP
jgi:transcriptional regulator with XRE-family HTH domain